MESSGARQTLTYTIDLQSEFEMVGTGELLIYSEGSPSGIPPNQPLRIVISAAAVEKMLREINGDQA